MLLPSRHCLQEVCMTTQPEVEYEAHEWLTAPVSPTAPTEHFLANNRFDTVQDALNGSGSMRGDMVESP